MEPSLIPPGKVIHIFFYAIRVPSGPSQIIPEGFPERAESEVDLGRKEHWGVQAELIARTKVWKKDHVERIA